LDIGDQLAEVRCSQASNWVPALGGEETEVRAARFSALVVTRGDVLEHVGALGLGGVKNGVDEAERGLASVLTNAVEERDDSSPDR